MQVRVIKMKFIPIEIVWPRHPTSHNRIEVRVDYLFLGVVLGNPSMVMFDAVNVVFSPSCVYPKVEEFSIGITFLDFFNPGTLLLSRPLHHT
jgi:hypothetical protein